MANDSSFKANELICEWSVQVLNYWRCIEIPTCLSELEEFNTFSGPVLDIGSPKVASVWMARQPKFSTVIATDVSDYFLNDLSHIRDILELADLKTMVADAVNLPFDDSSFASVVSISVLEHIPKDGDMQAMKQIANKLIDGGVAVVSVPYWIAPIEETAKTGELYWESHTDRNSCGVFYQRRYDRHELMKRIIEPSGLRVERIYLIGERPAPTEWGTFCDGQLVENWKYLSTTRTSLLCAKASKIFPNLPQCLHLYYSKKYHYFCERFDDPFALAAVLILRKQN